MGEASLTGDSQAWQCRMHKGTQTLLVRFKGKNQVTLLREVTVELWHLVTATSWRGERPEAFKRQHSGFQLLDRILKC